MVKKLIITFGTSLGILFLNVVTGILTARLLGPLGKGQLTAVTLWPGVLASIGNLGLVNAVVYYAGKDGNENTRRVWSGAFTIGLIQTLVLIVLGCFLLPLLMHQYSIEMIMTARIYLLFIPLNIFNLYCISIFQGRLQIGRYNILRFLVFGFNFIGVIILAYTNKVTVQSCAIVLLVSNAIVLIIKMLWLARFGYLGNVFDFSLVRNMLGYGLKSHIGNVSNLLNLRVDQMMMAIILSPDMLGLYVIAVTISSGVSLIGNTIATLTFPVLSAQNPPDNKKWLFARSIRMTVWCSGLIAIVFLLLINLLINFLYGKDYSQAIPAARFLIISAGVSGLNMTLASGLKGYGRPDIASLSEFISLFFTGILLWLLLPRWGIVGAAIASLVAYSCSFLSMYMYVNRKIFIRPKEILIPQKEDYVYIQSLSSSFMQNKLFLSGKKIS